MTLCRRCGEENPERARFCLACGLELPPSARAAEVRKTVTVLFCDVTGSTSLGERRDPEQLRRLLTSYFERARGAFERHGGHVEKFIGDAVMAVFGVPVVHEDDALRALRAAVELLEEIEALNEELERTLGERIEVRVGVNTGEVLAGDPTDRESFVSGDAVNVAQRLESAARPGEILVGETTFALARASIRAERLAALEVKGKREPVVAYRLLEIISGAAPGRRFDSPLVGRSREVSLIRDAFARAAEERSCHLFTILGPAGVGKSRLAAEALAPIALGATVVRGGCLSYGDGITFWPVYEIVRDATGILPDDEPAEALAKLEAAMGGEEATRTAALRVAELVGLAETGAVGEERFWAVRKLLEAIASRRPLVVVLDDVNWAEETLLDLIEHIADWSRDAPILLLCLARPELLDLRPGWGGGKRNATTIFLEPLSEAESEQLLAHLLLGAATPDVIARIHRAAEGNPLYVEEMVAMLIDRGLVVRDDGGWRAVGDLGGVEVPASIQLLLASRLDQLEAPERQTLERAAVEGVVFHRGAAAALVDGLEAEHVDACLRSLIRKELIRPATPSLPGEEAFRFRHALIRDAAYDAIPKGLRADLHERFAAWLEEHVGEDDEFTGYHLEQAYRYRVELARLDERERALALRAGLRLAAAGRRALAHGDAPAAASLLERAAGLLDEETEASVDLALVRAQAARQTGQLRRAADLLERSLASARQARDRGRETRARLELARLRPFVDPDSAAASELRLVAEAAASTFAELGDDAGRARALLSLADAHWLSCRVEPMEAVLERALRHVEETGVTHDLPELRYALVRAAAHGPMPVERALARCRGVLEQAGDDPLAEAVTLNALAYLEAMRAAFAEARRLAAQSRARLEDLGLVVMIATLDAWVGMIELLAGDLAAAERLWRGAQHRLEALGEKGNRSTIVAFLAEAALEQGDLAEADRLTAVSEQTAFRDDVTSQVAWRAARARTRVRQRELAEAERLAREAVAWAAETDWPDLRGRARVALAEALLALGRADEGVAAAREAIAVYEAKGNVAAAARTAALLERER